MKPSETVVLFAAMQAHDNRKIRPDQVAAYAKGLEDIDIRDALAAVTSHFQRSSNWLDLARIRALVLGEIPDAEREAERARRQTLLADAGPADYPDDLTWSQEREYGALYRRAVLAGMDRKSAHDAADTEFGAAPRQALVTAPAPVQRAIARFTAERAVR